jgi:hypothetical protein
MATIAAPTNRVYAELPSGEYLVPGTTAKCPGPGAFGGCPFDNPAARPCSGATWHYAGAAGWSFHFVDDSEMCPVTVLDPLGALPLPLD